MNCGRCGTGLPDSAAICPTCGTINSAAWPGGQQATNYGQYEPRGYDGPPLQQQAPYGQGYGPQPGYMPPQPNYGYGPQPHAVPPYQYAPGPVNVFVNNPPVSNTDNGPLIVEVLLSVFLGIYGVGWLMAGESTVGVILLICSFVVYLPGGGKLPIPSPLHSRPYGGEQSSRLASACFAWFPGGGKLPIPSPLHSRPYGAVVLNAVLLNNALKRKVAQVIMVQANPMPAQYPQYRQ